MLNAYNYCLYYIIDFVKRKEIFMIFLNFFDIYPFWNDKAILEIELSDEKADVSFPDFIKFIKEVTDDDNYKNASLANI